MNVNDSAYEATARRQFPLQDTLRRWIAPWDGTVTIEGPVVLRNAADSPDGVRVAIQNNGGELWSTTIAKGATGCTRSRWGSVPRASSSSGSAFFKKVPKFKGARAFLVRKML